MGCSYAQLYSLNHVPYKQDWKYSDIFFHCFFKKRDSTVENNKFTKFKT